MSVQTGYSARSSSRRFRWCLTTSHAATSSLALLLSSLSVLMMTGCPARKIVSREPVMIRNLSCHQDSSGQVDCACMSPVLVVNAKTQKQEIYCGGK
jgi:hypothetical protein